MNFWITLWTIVFALGMVIFTGVAIVVAIGGPADIKAMFAGIARHHDEAMEKGDL